MNQADGPSTSSRDTSIPLNGELSRLGTNVSSGIHTSWKYETRSGRSSMTPSRRSVW